MTYRTDINEKIDSLWIFSTKKVEWRVKLNLWFYISRDLRTMLKDVPRPLEYFYRGSISDFADFVGYTRQNVRHAIVANGRYVFLRKWYYEKDKLIEFLNNFIWLWSKYEK